MSSGAAAARNPVSSLPSGSNVSIFMRGSIGTQPPLTVDPRPRRALHGAVGLALQLLGEALLLGSDLGFGLGPMRRRHAFGAAGALPDFIGAIANPMFVPITAHFFGLPRLSAAFYHQPELE